MNKKFYKANIYELNIQEMKMCNLYSNIVIKVLWHSAR